MIVKQLNFFTKLSGEKYILIAFCILFTINCLNSNSLFYVPDDSYIYFRHARHFLDGQGLVYNIGEHVEGISGLSWAFLLILFSVADPVKIIIISKLLGIVCSLGTLIFIFYSIKALFKREYLYLILGSIALGLLNLDKAFIHWTTAGLESPLFILLVSAILYKIVKRIQSLNKLLYDDWLIHLLFFLLFITRTEGIFYYFFYLFFAYLISHVGIKFSSKPNFLKNGLLFFIIPSAIITVFRLLYYNDFLPNSVWAKGIGLPYWGHMRLGVRYVSSFFQSSNTIVPFIALTASFFIQNLIVLKRFLTLSPNTPIKIFKSRLLGRNFISQYNLYRYLSKKEGYFLTFLLLAFCIGPIIVAIKSCGDWMSYHRLLLQTRVLLLFYSAFLFGLLLDLFISNISFLKKKASGKLMAVLIVAILLISIGNQAISFKKTRSFASLWNLYDKASSKIADWISFVKKQNKDKEIIVVTEVGGRTPYYSLDTYFIEYFGLADKVIARRGTTAFPMGKIHNEYVAKRNADILIFNNPDRARWLFNDYLEGEKKYHFVELLKSNRVILVKKELNNSIKLSKILAQQFGEVFDLHIIKMPHIQ